MALIDFVTCAFSAMPINKQLAMGFYLYLLQRVAGKGKTCSSSDGTHHLGEHRPM